MKMRADEFLGMLNKQGIKCSIRRGHVMLSGGNEEILRKLRRVLLSNPEFEGGLVRHIQQEAGLTAGEYLRECENAGISLQVNAMSYDIDMAGGSEKTRARLHKILDIDTRLKARVILFEAMKDSALMDSIKERASIRWENGLSDSLLLAVLCNLIEIDETEQRDANEHIILKPKTDWEAELSNLRE